jgi:hypothetical protein
MDDVAAVQLAAWDISTPWFEGRGPVRGPVPVIFSHLRGKPGRDPHRDRQRRAGVRAGAQQLHEKVKEKDHISNNNYNIS